jgi:hypothetical protein
MGQWPQVSPYKPKAVDISPLFYNHSDYLRALFASASVFGGGVCRHQQYWCACMCIVCVIGAPGFCFLVSQFPGVSD